MGATVADMIPLKIDIHPDKELEGWVAGRPELDFYSQRSTLEKTWQSLLEAFRFWLS